MKRTFQWILVIALLLVASPVHAYLGNGGIWAVKPGDFIRKNFSGDSAGFRAAISYLGSSGGQVDLYVTSINFGTTPVFITSPNVAIRGLTYRATRLQFTGTGRFLNLGYDDGDHSGNPDTYSGTVSQIQLENIELFGPGKGTASWGLVDWESGSNYFDRVWFQQWGTAYVGIGADVQRFTQCYFLKNGRAAHVSSRSDQTEFYSCTFSENNIGLLNEYARGMKVWGGVFYASDTADVIVDAPASTVFGSELLSGNNDISFYGTWFESIVTLPRLDRHIWLGRGGTSSRRIDGIRIQGCQFFTNLTRDLVEIDAASQVLIDHATNNNTITGYFARIGNVSGLDQTVALREPVANAGADVFFGGTLQNSQQLISKENAVQSIAWASSITPAAENAPNVTVALTGNLTVNAPTEPYKGRLLTFVFTQDATGGRTVTWNAAFKHSWSDTGNTANKVSTISFIYNGANWIQLGAQSPYN